MLLGLVGSVEIQGSLTYIFSRAGSKLVQWLEVLVLLWLRHMLCRLMSGLRHESFSISLAFAVVPGGKLLVDTT